MVRVEGLEPTPNRHDKPFSEIMTSVLTSYDLHFDNLAALTGGVSIADVCIDIVRRRGLSVAEELRGKQLVDTGLPKRSRISVPELVWSTGYTTRLFISFVLIQILVLAIWFVPAENKLIRISWLEMWEENVKNRHFPNPGLSLRPF